MTSRRIKRGVVAGFTLVEVMTAVALMTIGASGIVMMQGATTRANQLAQESTVAVSFAQTWVERLKRDSLLWIDVGEAARTAAPGPVYLSAALSSVGTDIWNLPVLANGASHAADAYGYDVDTGNALNFPRIRYCVNFRNVVQHVAPNAFLAPDTDTLRVDVRVWWVRAGDARSVLMGPGADPCLVPPDENAITRGEARVVYVSNVVRWRAPTP